MKYGACTWSWPVKVKDSFAFAKELGLDGISISIEVEDGICQLSEVALQEEYLELSKKYDVEIAALAVNALCTYGMSKSSKYDIVKSILEQSVAIAKNMGVKVLQLPSFMDGEIHNEEELVQTIQCLTYAVFLVEGTGIEIGYENVLTYEENMRIYEIMKDKPYFIYFDTQNPVRFANMKEPEVLAERLMPYIQQMHVKDSYEDVTIPLQLGEGTTRYHEVIQKFIDSGYDKWVILESEYAVYPNYKEIIEKDIVNLKKIFAR
ncbi:MAG: sugar phosphate isomerase/epimerase family protein [Eubacteriales bacterium]